MITGMIPAKFRAVGTGRLSIMDQTEATEVLELEVKVPGVMVDTEVKEEAGEVTGVADPVTVAVEDTQPGPEDRATLVEAVDPVEVTEAAVVLVEEVEERALVEDMTVGGARVVAAAEETTTKDTRQAHEELTDTEVEVGQ